MTITFETWIFPLIGTLASFVIAIIWTSNQDCSGMFGNALDGAVAMIAATVLSLGMWLAWALLKIWEWI